MLRRQHNADLLAPGELNDRVRVVSRPAQEADIRPVRLQGRLLFRWRHFVQTNHHLRKLCAERGHERTKRA
jgi:predicted secreted protein